MCDQFIFLQVPIILARCDLSTSIPADILDYMYNWLKIMLTSV